jgi:23S rRNA (cytosine1962-C5)-methyltransferase
MSPHPWIWRALVAPPDLRRGLEPGDEVRVEDKDGEPLGRALYHPRATIALRMLTSNADEPIDAAFFERRIGEALRFRRERLRLEERTDGYRIVHAESDGLSGLMIDRVGPVVSIEVFTSGMARRLPEIEAALAKLLPGAPVIARADARTSSIEGFSVKDSGHAPKHAEVREDGVRFKVDLEKGHKTGFFLDQRDNRSRIATLAKGARVLDLFCYTGGFSLRAIGGGAAESTGVDLDEKAIEVAKKNANLNQSRDAKFVHSDVFPWLRDAKRAGKTWDVVVLDPPKLAASREEVAMALRKYFDLNRLALDVVADGGVLLTCSCSGSVSEEAFLDMVARTGANARKDLSVFEVAGAAPDHPVALHAPETRYLKAVFVRVKGR